MTIFRRDLDPRWQSDPALSFKARGLILEILKEPSCTVKDLVGAAADGSTSVDGGLNELKRLHYLQGEPRPGHHTNYYLVNPTPRPAVTP